MSLKIIPFIVMLIFGIIGAGVIAIVIHEYSHKYDYREIPKNNENIIEDSQGNEILKKDDDKYGNGLGFFSASDIPHLKTNVFKNVIRLILASIIFISLFLKKGKLLHE